MVDFYGVNMTKLQNSPVDRVDVSELVGRRRVANDVFEAAGAAIGDEIIVAQIQKGAKIQPDFMVLTDALGANSTLQLRFRTLADPATEIPLMVAAVATNTAAKIEAVVADIANFPYTTPDVGEVFLKVAGGAVTGTIKSFLTYVVD